MDVGFERVENLRNDFALSLVQHVAQADTPAVLRVDIALAEETIERGFNRVPLALRPAGHLTCYAAFCASNGGSGSSL